MEKFKYPEVEIDVIYFKGEDVIVTSVPSPACPEDEYSTPPMGG